MDISLEDLKVALNRAQVNGFTTTDDLAAFAWGYLSAGPLIADAVAEAEADTTHGYHVGDEISEAETLEYLPVGTVLKDRDGDYHELHEDGWAWDFYPARHVPLVGDKDGFVAIIPNYLPATIVKLGN